MIDIKEMVRNLTTRFVYKVKVKQGYDDLTFEFNDIDEAAQFAQTCLEKCIKTHGEFEDIHITITLDEVKSKFDKNGEESEKKPVEKKQEESETESETENKPTEAENKEEEQL